jgi:hypothetical protein
MTEDLLEWDGAPVSAELELTWLEVVDLEYVEGVPIGLSNLDMVSSGCEDAESGAWGWRTRSYGHLAVVVSADKAMLGSVSTSINA